MVTKDQAQAQLAKDIEQSQDHRGQEQNQEHGFFDLKDKGQGYPLTLLVYYS